MWKEKGEGKRGTPLRTKVSWKIPKILLKNDVPKPLSTGNSNNHITLQGEKKEGIRRVNRGLTIHTHTEKEVSGHSVGYCYSEVFK